MKKVVGFVKLHVPGGQANPAPPVGPALGQHGVNIMEFCKQFNSRTQDKIGYTVPVEITVYGDRTFTFITKTPPAALRLGGRVVGLAELHDVHAVLAERGADRRGRGRGPGLDLELDDRGELPLLGGHRYSLFLVERSAAMATAAGIRSSRPG